MKVKIYYHHTDCGGVVYYANYLKFLEEARTEFLADKGLSVSELAKQGILFVVARQEIDYKAPAFYADELHVHTKLSSVGRVKMEFTYDVVNQHEKIVCSAKTILVCVGKDLKPQAMPEEVLGKISLNPKFEYRNPKQI